jgi:hypothetical protein
VFNRNLIVLWMEIWSLLNIISLLGLVLLGLKLTFKNLGYSLTTFDLLGLLHIKGSIGIAFVLLS